MATLLDRVREINQLVPRSVEVTDDDFSPMLEALSKAVDANAYLVGADGALLGRGLTTEPECGRLDLEESVNLSPGFQQRLAFLSQSTVNLPLEECPFHGTGCPVPKGMMAIIPIQSGGERFGNLILTRREGGFDENDLIVAEAGAAIIGLTILHHRLERSEADARQKANVQVALDSLSFSELQAIASVFDELGGSEGFLVASKIADRIGITRSVIVNAMRKLESAGVVETRSLGMKGTYIRIRNLFLLEELTRRTKAK